MDMVRAKQDSIKHQYMDMVRAKQLLFKVEVKATQLSGSLINSLSINIYLSPMTFAYSLLVLVYLEESLSKNFQEWASLRGRHGLMNFYKCADLGEVWRLQIDKIKIMFCHYI